jgi:hypothetical protein
MNVALEYIQSCKYPFDHKLLWSLICEITILKPNIL